MARYCCMYPATASTPTWQLHTDRIYVATSTDAGSDMEAIWHTPTNRVRCPGRMGPRLGSFYGEHH